MIIATLAKASPLNAIFPTGRVALTRPGCFLATLGTESGRVYMLDLGQVTKEQKQKMAVAMAAAGQGTEKEALEHLNKAEELPIQEHHVSSVGMPLKQFI